MSITSPYVSFETKVFTFSVLLNGYAVAIDQDGDGMNDVWQKVNSINAFDALSDPDKDGETNLAKSNAGPPYSKMSLSNMSYLCMKK